MSHPVSASKSAVDVLDGLSMRHVKIYLAAFRATQMELSQLERTGDQDWFPRHGAILSSARIALTRELQFTKDVTLHAFDVGLEHLVEPLWNELNFRSGARLQHEQKDRVIKATEMVATLIKMLEAIVVLDHTHRDYNGHR